MASRRKKKKLIIRLFFIIILSALIILGILYYIKINKLNFEFNSDKTFEIFSEVKYKDLISNIENGELLNGEEIIDTSSLGKKEITLKFKNKEKESEVKVIIQIVDKTSPEIEVKDTISTFVGTDIDLLTFAKVTDNSKEELKATIEGKYDLKKEGSYNIKFIAVDSSGNKSEKETTLKVTKDPNNYTFTTPEGFNGEVKDGITYIDGILIANKTYSLPSTYNPGLSSTLKKAFNKLSEGAKNDGYDIYISSGFRSYKTQKDTYNYWVSLDGKELADTYSARPGYSEHQTGLAVDVNTIDDSFADTPEGKWLNDNCYKYGFILRYPKGKQNVTGYKYESWHIRYVGVDLATKLYNNGKWITLEEYFGITSEYK